MYTSVKRFFGYETDAEKLYRITVEFMTDKKELTVKAFNEAMGTTMLDNGLTPEDNYMETFLESGGCFEEKNILLRQEEEFKKNYANTNGLKDRLLKIQEENIELEKENDAYRKILIKYKKLNHKFSLQKFLFGEIEPQEYFI